MVKKERLFLFLFFSVLFNFSLYAQEKSVMKSEQDDMSASSRSSSAFDSDISYYFSAPLTFEEINSLQKRAYARVQNLQKNSRTRKEDFALLENAQLLGFLYPSIDDERVQASIFDILCAVRNEFLSYSAKNKDDYKIKTELAFLIHAGALAYQKDDYYQFTRIISRLASEVYNKTPNAKVALVLGQWYIGSNMGHSPAINNTLAQKYLNKVIELDKESSYISYLAYIYLSNLYFKTRKGDKAREYMNKAKALYPDGAFAYIVDEIFFADGKALF